MFTIETPILIWLCGNYTVDTKLFNDNDSTITKRGYGGSVFFGSWTIETFFKNISFDVFSNGYPRSFLENNKLLSAVLDLDKEPDDEETKILTHYILDYRFPIRKLGLGFFPPGIISPPTTPENFPDIIMLTPVYHELLEESAIKLKNLFPKALLSCDPQGWCRIKDHSSNEIHIKEWVPTDQFLEAISILKMSVEDLLHSSKQDLEGFIERIVKKNVILIITGGTKGTICFFPDFNAKSKFCYLTPVNFLSKVGDTTGAGDVWLVSFTIWYLLTKNLINSLATATILTSVKIQHKSLKNSTLSINKLESSIQQHEHTIQLLPMETGLRIIFSA